MLVRSCLRRLCNWSKLPRTGRSMQGSHVCSAEWRRECDAWYINRFCIISSEASEVGLGPGNWIQDSVVSHELSDWQPSSIRQNLFQRLRHCLWPHCPPLSPYRGFRKAPTYSKTRPNDGIMRPRGTNNWLKQLPGLSPFTSVFCG